MEKAHALQDYPRCRPHSRRHWLAAMGSIGTGQLPVIQSTGLSCEPIDSPAARLMSQNPLCADATRARNGHQPQMFGAIKDRTFKEGGDEVAGWVMSRDMAAGQRFIGLRDSVNADDYAAAVTKLVRDLDINTVPTFIVNSRYRVVVTNAVPETISELELVVNSLRRQR